MNINVEKHLENVLSSLDRMTDGRNIHAMANIKQRLHFAIECCQGIKETKDIMKCYTSLSAIQSDFAKAFVAAFEDCHIDDKECCELTGIVVMMHEVLKSLFFAYSHHHVCKGKCRYENYFLGGEEQQIKKVA